MNKFVKACTLLGVLGAFACDEAPTAQQEWAPPTVAFAVQDQYGYSAGTNDCMEDIVQQVDGTNAVPLNCTANDLDLFFTVVAGGSDLPLCLPGDPLPDLTLEANFVATAANRWDIGLWIRDDNLPIANALRGDCRHWSLVNSGGTTVTPTYNEDGDTCLDLAQGDTTTLAPITLTGLICQDTNSDGFLDIGACVGYDNNGNQASDCSTAESAINDTRPNTKAKCQCGPMAIPVRIAGKIIVEKQTIPDGDAASFAFTGELVGSISDGGTIEKTVEAGTYQVTETALAGWDLTSIVCNDANSTGSVATRTATFMVAAGETVKCTFTNTKEGSVVVKKVMVGGTSSFDFTGTPAGSISVNNGTISAGVDPGQYVSTEAAKAGWTLTSIVCDDANSTGNTTTRAATFNVEAGETVTCTFTNTKNASLTIVKDAQPNDAEDFAYTTTGAGLSSFDLDDDADPTLSNQKVFSDLAPGVARTVVEGAEANWAVTSITCTGAANYTGTVGTRTLAITLQPGEEATCTFVNQRLPRLVVEKIVVGGGTQSFDFTRTGIAQFALTTGQTNDSGFTLAPGNYTVCELTLAVSWAASASLTPGGAVVLVNPDAPADLGTRCYTIALGYGDDIKITFTNMPPPGGDARTIGYWRNWSSCTGGKQYVKAQANGMLDKTLDGNLPQTIGDLVVDSCAEGVNILSKRDLNGTNMAKDAAYSLAAQLLAAKLNISAGAGFCSDATDAIADAQALLDGINFTGVGSYLRPADGQLYHDALELAGILDSYNNNTLCP